MSVKTDGQVLRDAITQILVADLTKDHGWREGVSYHTGCPTMAPDMVAGEQLLARGVMTRGYRSSLHLSESAVIRALHVAVDAAVADLLANDPPPASFAEELEEDEIHDEDNHYLVLVGLENEPGIRSW